MQAAVMVDTGPGAFLPLSHSSGLLLEAYLVVKVQEGFLNCTP